MSKENISHNAGVAGIHAYGRAWATQETVAPEEKSLSEGLAVLFVGGLILFMIFLLCHYPVVFLLACLVFFLLGILSLF